MIMPEEASWQSMTVRAKAPWLFSGKHPAPVPALPSARASTAAGRCTRERGAGGGDGDAAVGDVVGGTSVTQGATKQCMRALYKALGEGKSAAMAVAEANKLVASGGQGGVGGSVRLSCYLAE